MILKDSKGREVECEFDQNGDRSVFVLNGTYVETGADVSEDELNWITDNYPETMDEISYDRSVMAAESYYEGDR